MAQECRPGVAANRARSAWRCFAVLCGVLDALLSNAGLVLSFLVAYQPTISWLGSDQPAPLAELHLASRASLNLDVA
jgi:hypothetical protein